MWAAPSGGLAELGFRHYHRISHYHFTACEDNSDIGIQQAVLSSHVFSMHVGLAQHSPETDFVPGHEQQWTPGSSNRLPASVPCRDCRPASQPLRRAAGGSGGHTRRGYWP